MSPNAQVLHVGSHTWLQDPNTAAHLQQGLTAYLALDDAFLSIASRLYLIRQAKHHLDLQYYIWKDDEIGRMMLAELLKAADRGVKVRLLLDDQNGTQLDPQLQALTFLFINKMDLPDLEQEALIRQLQGLAPQPHSGRAALPVSH